MKKSLFVLGIVILAVVAIYSYNYAVGLPPEITRLFTGSVQSPQTQTSVSVPPSSVTSSSPDQEVPYKMEIFAENLYVPWSIVFTSPERMLFTERDGSVRAVINGQLEEDPLFSPAQISERGEEGMMGMTLHPDYENNKMVYLAYAYPAQGGVVVRVERFKDDGTKLTRERTIIDNIPAATNHAGTRIKFGPDNKLYITTGDASERQIAQDMKSLGGKILRLNDDGSVPDDNPFEGSPIYSLGHRNSQGIDWHPETKDLWETEHGPSGFDGPGGGDEVNLIVAGGNYGWPEVSHEETDPDFVTPKIVYTPAVAPASGMFYSGDVFPQFKNNFFFGGLRGQGIYRVVLDGLNPQNVERHEKLADVDVGRVRDVVQGPDGFIYFSTSNQDGRGSVREGDDKIYRLVPQ